MIPEQYKTIITNNETKTHREAEGGSQRNIDREAKTISKTLQLEKRMEHYAKRPAFISLKFHKKNSNIAQNAVLLTPPKMKWV